MSAGWLIGGGVDPALDNMVMHTMKVQSAPSEDYGKYRVWGAIGWGVMALLLGYLSDKYGLDSLLDAYAVSMTLYTLVMLNYPIMQGSAKEETKGLVNKEPASDTKLTWSQYLRALFSQPGVPTFLAMVAVMGIVKSTIDVFLFLFLQNELGASNLILGLSLGAAVTSEIPFFYFAGPILRRYGTVPVFLVATVAYGIRTLCYSFLRNPWLVLPIELLHGVTLSLAWSGIVLHANRISPPGYTGTTQAVVSATCYGFGWVIGGLAGGFVLEDFDAKVLYLGDTVLCAIAVALGSFAFYSRMVQSV